MFFGCTDMFVLDPSKHLLRFVRPGSVRVGDEWCAGVDKAAPFLQTFTRKKPKTPKPTPLYPEVRSPKKQGRNPKVEI